MVRNETAFSSKRFEVLNEILCELKKRKRKIKGIKEKKLNQPYTIDIVVHFLGSLHLQRTKN
jgi:hypothetical protein